MADAPHRFMLDTNIASFIIRGASPGLRETLASIAPSRLCLSAITQAELLYGLARRPGATRLQHIVEMFLLQMEILPWMSAAARSYAQMRASLDADGQSFGNMDLLIAAHAHAEHAVLVSNDRSLQRLSAFVEIVDWN